MSAIVSLDAHRVGTHHPSCRCDACWRDLQARAQSTPQLEDERLVDVKEVCRLLSVSKPTVYGLMESGELPGLVVGARSRRWRLCDVRAYIARRAGGRPTT